MLHTILLSACFLFCFQAFTYGQCCSAGNPSSFSFTDNNSLKTKILHVSSSYKYGYSGKYYAGSEPEDVSFTAPASYSFIDLKAAYGISKRLTFEASSGYFFSKEQQNPDPYPSDIGYGLGDAELNVRYRAYKSVTKHIELTASAGIRLPVGVFDLEKDGVKLPITVQPSAGSFVYLAGFSAAKTFTENKLKLFSSIFMEFPQLINSKNFYYRYGNLYNLSISAAFPVHKLLNPGLQIQAEIREHATREDEQLVEASGYKVIILSPQIESDFGNNWSVLVYTDLPVFRYFNGMQLANSFKAGIRVSKRINLG
jgi:hypothetical protein